MKKFLGALVVSFCLAFPAWAKELPDFTDLVEKFGPVVVNISTTQTIKHERVAPRLHNLPDDDSLNEFFRRFAPQMPGMPKEFETHSLGSGFIVSGDGYILTNAHVVDKAEEVLVKLTDKREFKAKVIGSDKKTDVALIKIEASNLPVATLGDADKLKVGEWVVAIGSPFGFDNSVTAGIVSAKGRSLPADSYVPFIQTDVAVNPGNSGGPLFNLKGEVVGINSQIYSRTGGFMGLSFAIPISVAMDVSSQLKDKGKVVRGWLGVRIQEVTKDLAESFGLPKSGGALVAKVEKGGPADKAGILSSDIITRFDGKAVESSNELPRLVGQTKVGKPVKVEVWRKGETKQLALTVGEFPDEDKLASGKKPGKPAAKVAGKLGLTLAELTESQKEQLKIGAGVLVEEVAGQAAKAGIRRGDVILAVNNQDVTSPEQFNELLVQFESRKSVAVLVRRGETALYLPLKIAQK